MTRKTRRNYEKEAKADPFELELDNAHDGHPGYITFLNPNRLPAETANELNREIDLELQLRKLLSEDDFPPFWDEWRKVPVDELRALIDDVMDHYGANRGKLPR
jgi:hypothetical protein